jgi:CHASE2 domain-containing sensor protein
MSASKPRRKPARLRDQPVRDSARELTEVLQQVQQVLELLQQGLSTLVDGQRELQIVGALPNVPNASIQLRISLVPVAPPSAVPNA